MKCAKICIDLGVTGMRRWSFLQKLKLLGDIDS